MIKRCKCGRMVTASVQRSGLNRYSYFRCECGREWTVTETVSDLADAVTSDELIEVHKQLQKPNPLKELLP